MGLSAENSVEALVSRAPGIENNPDRSTDVASRCAGRPGSLGRLFVRSLILIACLFTVTVAVAAPPSQPNAVSGVLSASVSSTPSNVNLTSEGSGDWAHWGLSSATSVNRKSGVTSQISAMTALGSSGRRFQGGGSRASYNWTDGTPTGSASTTAGLYFQGAGNGFEFNVPADTTAKTLTVHLGGYQARGQIEVSLSDGTVPPYVATVEDLLNPFDRTLTINFQAASPGQTLTVRYSKLAGDNVTLQAVTLVGEVAPLGLPFSDNFDDGNSDGWAFVNETPLADAWSAGGGSLIQANAIESVASFEESYHLGSYAWLPAGASLTDYRVSARLERTGTGRAESLGILFRYRDVDNFYRFTLNTRYGFGRLEKREGGVYFTLAVNAFGDDPTSPFTLGIDVDGQDIRVSVDGLLNMAATDGAHAFGSVGLFTQSPSKFDDVIIAPIVASPDVKLVLPVAMTVVPGSQVDAAAVVRDLPPGGAVEFSMNGRAPVTLAAPPWTTTFSSVPAGPVTVTVRILDSGNSPVDSHNVDFAIGGDYVVAIGDSITNGVGDTYAADNDDALRVFSNTAYASVLASRLEAMPPTEAIVYNEGIGGDDAAAADLLRLQSIIERHPSGSVALVQLGTNDANSGRTAAAFESDMQSIVDRLVAEGMTVNVATLPPILGGSNPLSSDANQSIAQYNDEIANNLAGSLPGADLWAYFAPDDTGDEIADRVRQDLFADDLHPNALGHAIIADLWYNALLGDSTGTTIVPFVVDALSRTNYKQNLLEPGDAYLVDSAATLTDVPTALASAIWIMPAQSDAGSTATSFLEFDLDRSATVYVAYDADAGSLPEWLNPATSGFVDTSQQLTTTQTNYRIFSAPFGVGTVSLGGNHAIGGGDAADMYLVGLLPGT